MTRRAPLAAALLLLSAATHAAADAPRARAVVVKLRAEGPHAVAECAETAWRAGRPLAAASADASGSLDRLQRRLAPRSVRAIFRRPDGRPFAAQRQRWQSGIRARRSLARAASTNEALPDLSHVYRVELPAGVDATAAAALYRADPHVAWAQPDYPMQLDFTPDDPFLFSSGSWGQPYADLWGLYAIRAPDAWSYTRGEGAVIAVIDSGLDATHPDIVENLWVNPGEDLDGDGIAGAADRNGVDDDGNGLVDDLTGYDFFNDDADPFDDAGHGTHVAGTAAARGGNGIGILGVAPLARVMALKGFPAQGSGDTSALAQGIVYAAQSGADVMNNSWSCSVRCPVNPLIDEAVLLAHALGTVVVTSAGNTADDVVFQSPKKLRETLVVASSREDGSIAPSSGHGLLLDLAAPGAGRDIGVDPFAANAILSLLSSGAPPGFSARVTVAEIYLRLAGTSMAAPHVAGVVALVRALHPEMTPEEIRTLLRATARDAGAPGHDPRYGAGIVDALAAVTGSAPALRGQIEQPGPGAILDARAGVIEVRGRAGGDDFTGYALEFGRGLEPAAWQPIAAAGAGPVSEGGLLAKWDVSALPDGPYALRLTLTGAGGDVVQEFAPLSLERNAPRAVSAPEALSFAPDISGSLVVYQSARADTGTDVFAADFRREGELTVTDARGDQQQPRVSGRRIVWRDVATEPGGEIHTCVADGRLRRCDDDLAVAVGPALRSGPVVSGSRILWTERDSSRGESPRLCDLARGARWCHERPVAVREETQSELEVSGRRLLWIEKPSFALWTCVLVPRNGACPAQLVNLDAQFQSAPVVSGERFAWEQFAFWPGFGLGYRVNVCALDPAGGACPPLLAGDPSQSEPAPDLSDDTLVWNADAPGEPSAIWFCEHDLLTGRCPAQRLSGSAAGARKPAIDGRRVVFEDERDGPTRIYAFELPDLRVVGSRSVRVGRVLRLDVLGHDPSVAAARMQLSAQLADGASVESVGMKFSQESRRAGRLFWRPEAGDVGRTVVTFAAATEGGLVTRESVEIAVDAAQSAGGASASAEMSSSSRPAVSGKKSRMQSGASAPTAHSATIADQFDPVTP